jgi:hypothetical protein
MFRQHIHHPVLHRFMLLMMSKHTTQVLMHDTCTSKRQRGLNNAQHLQAHPTKRLGHMVRTAADIQSQ